jgi:glutathione-regulated potassium-efflux system ancillary protein KefC/glutathione-regulated potassium-efflux system protein KefB
MAEQVLEWLGADPADARRSVALFRAHDEATLADQQAIKDDDEKLMVTARESAAQLERLFESDRANR